MAPGANAPPPTASCDQLNSAGQGDNDESMALPDEEYRESGNESDVAPLQNEEGEPGDGLTGKTSVDFFVFFCNDSLDFKKWHWSSDNLLNPSMSNCILSLYVFWFPTGLAGTVNCNNLLVIPSLLINQHYVYEF